MSSRVNPCLVYSSIFSGLGPRNMMRKPRSLPRPAERAFKLGVFLTFSENSQRHHLFRKLFPINRRFGWNPSTLQQRIKFSVVQRRSCSRFLFHIGNVQQACWNTLQLGQTRMLKPLIFLSSSSSHAKKTFESGQLSTAACGLVMGEAYIY